MSTPALLALVLVPTISLLLLVGVVVVAVQRVRRAATEARACLARLEPAAGELLAQQAVAGRELERIAARRSSTPGT